MNGNPVVGIGGGGNPIPCAGNPNRPGHVLYDCVRSSRYLVVSTQLLLQDGEGPVAVIIGACESHVLGVQEWMRDRTIDTCKVLGVEYTDDDEPAIFGVERLGELVEHFGESAWVGTRTA